jgi:hypothetical protein
MEAYQRQQPPMQQTTNPQYEQDLEDGMAELPNPQMGSTAVSQDQVFMKWLFSFRKEVVDPLGKTWRGYEFDHEKQLWVYNKDSVKIMNEKGISWCISLIESYINPVFIVSNFDKEMMNYTMREVVRVIFNSLCLRYKEFDMKKSDIPRVANEIESKVLAILLGARGDGFRIFFSKQYHVSEQSNFGGNNQQERRGMLGGMMNMFSPKKAY